MANALIVSLGKKKEQHKLKADNSVLFGKLSEDYKLGGILSDISKGFI